MKQIDELKAELEDIRKRLRGHPNSKLSGENGLAAATIDRMDVLNSALKEALDAWENQQDPEIIAKFRKLVDD